MSDLSELLALRIRKAAGKHDDPRRSVECIVSAMADRIEALEAEVALLRETLESIYQWTVTSEDPEHICGWVEVEAREALAKDKDQET